LKAIYSRTQASAEALSKVSGEEADIYYESPTSPSHSIDALLNRKDVEAVVIAVPILASGDLIRKAIAAKKHVLSEKPIAQDIAVARNLLEYYRHHHQKLSSSEEVLWAVGENFRFWNSVNRAAEILRGLEAKLVTFRTSVYNLMGPDNKYFHTEW